MKSTPARCLLSLALAATLPVSAATADASSDARLKQAERGLRAPLSFEGETGWVLEERMRHYGVPGLQLAIIDDGRVVATRSYGLADRRAKTKVDDDTLFQSASISKAVAAFGAMRMVEQGELALEAPVNTVLRTWKLPDNDWTRSEPVTLRHLLSHTGGLGVHGFLGYTPGAPIPTLLQTLEGQPPSNSPAVRVEQRPGQAFRYSGGGYTVAQLMMSDVAGRAFPDLMWREVLKPAGMRHSTFEFPLAAKRLRHATAGVDQNGVDIVGGHRVHNSSAAAGLWTTAGDLARFGVEVQRALRGESRLMKPATAERMLRDPGPDHYALGFAITHENGQPYFGHEGWNEGFSSALVANREGDGVAIMINANQPQLMQEVRRAVAFAYDWPGYREYRRQPVTEAALRDLPGRYPYNAEQFILISREGEQLFFAYGGEKRFELVALGGDRYARPETGLVVEIRADAAGGADFAFVSSDGRLDRQARFTKEQRPLRERVYAGDAEVVADYRKLQQAGDILGSEAYLNNQGYRLVGDQRQAEAVKLFALVTELYPQSANAWDSLGEAELLAGDRDAAKRHYEKALSLDPTLPSAKAALEKLATP